MEQNAKSCTLGPTCGFGLSLQELGILLVKDGGRYSDNMPNPPDQGLTSMEDYVSLGGAGGTRPKPQAATTPLCLGEGVCCSLEQGSCFPGPRPLPSRCPPCPSLAPSLGGLGWRACGRPLTAPGPGADSSAGSEQEEACHAASCY